MYQFLNQKNTYKRNQDKLKDDRRELKHKILILYFQIQAYQKAERFYRQQLRFASFISRLNRQKASIKKATEAEKLQATTEYLRSQSLFEEAKDLTEQTEELLRNEISDPAF